MTILGSLLTAMVLTGLKVQADDSLSTPNHPPQFSKPTWEGDEHDQPVFTSPAITNWSSTNMPPMTNWPATNHQPPMTNPPIPQPPQRLSGVPDVAK